MGFNSKDCLFQVRYFTTKSWIRIFHLVIDIVVDMDGETLA